MLTKIAEHQNTLLATLAIIFGCAFICFLVMSIALCRMTVC